MSSVSISGNNTLRNLHYTGRARLTGKRSGLVGRLEMAKAAYSVRRVDLSDVSDVIAGVRPSPGDLVLARVSALGQRQTLQSGNGRKRRLWPGDEIVVAYGERYAPDFFEAVVPMIFLRVISSQLAGSPHECSAGTVTSSPPPISRRLAC